MFTDQSSVSWAIQDKSSPPCEDPLCTVHRTEGIINLPYLFVKISILLFAAVVKFLELLERLLSWESQYLNTAFNSVTQHFERSMLKVYERIPDGDA
jgi:hypothetical protein